MANPEEKNKRPGVSETVSKKIKRGETSKKKVVARKKVKKVKRKRVPSRTARRKKRSPTKAAPKKKPKPVRPPKKEGKKGKLWAWLGGGISVLLIGSCCLIGGGWFLFSRGSGPLLGGGGRFPHDEVKILEETQEAVDEHGDQVSLGNLKLDIPAGAVAGDSTLTVAEVDPDSLPVEYPEDIVGEVYALEWESGSTPTGDEKMTVTFSYDPDDLPEEASEEEMVITTFDGAEWLQLPTRVDSRKHELTAEVRHFSFFGALWNASGLGWETTCDIRFHGRVYYTDGRYPGDPRATTIPAATMGYAVVDADGILLHEGFLGSDGSFDFVLREGMDVGFGVDPFLRVYAESPLAGKVKNTTALGAGVITYHGQVVEYDDYHCPSNVDLSLRIPLEDSAVFKILQSVYLGLATAIGVDGSLDTSNPTVIWGGAGDYATQTTDTGFKTFNDGQDAYIYIGNDPQVAWDEDVVLSAYGQYLLYWLSGQESLPCTARLGEVDRRVSACSAWAEGFGMYFSALARGDSVYESYEFTDINPITYDLDSNQFSSDQRSPGAVAQALWELTDGGINELNVANLLRLLREQKTSIASLKDLYNHWDITYGLTPQECLIFAEKDVVDEEDCGDDFLSEEPDQSEEEPVINRHTIEYDISTSSTLAWEGRDIWRFDGLADDVLSIKILAIDEDLDIGVILTQAWNNKVVNDTVLFEESDGYWEWQAKLENDGEHFILVDAYDSEGQYSIDLELMQRWLDDEQDESVESAPEEEVSASQPDPDSEIRYGQTITDEYLEDGEIQWWEFTAQAEDEISILFWAEDEDFRPYLYLGEDASGEILVETESTGSDPYQISVGPYTLPKDGLYFIGAGSLSGEGDYGLSLYLEDSAEDVEPAEESQESGGVAGTLYDEIDLGGVHYSDGAISFDFHVPANYTRVEVGCYDVAKDEHSYTQYCGWRGELQLNGDYVYDWVDWNSSDGGIYHNYILDEDVKTAHIDDSGFLDITPMILSGVNTLTLDHNNEGDGIGIVVRIYTD